MRITTTAAWYNSLGDELRWGNLYTVFSLGKSVILNKVFNARKVHCDCFGANYSDKLIFNYLYYTDNHCIFSAIKSNQPHNTINSGYYVSKGNL